MIPVSIQKDCECIVTALKEKLGDNLIAAALFGSYARGDYQEGSDIDILLIARNLPENHLERMVFLNKAVIECKRSPGFVPKTPEEFDRGFPSFYLDLGLDAIILYDTNEFLEQRLNRIREITEEAGLYRTGGRHNFYWNWKKRPKPGRWKITWEGFYESL